MIFNTGENSFLKGNFLQVLLLSFSFMFVFTAFQTTGIIEETVLQSIRNESFSCSVQLSSTTIEPESQISNSTTELNNTSSSTSTTISTLKNVENTTETVDVNSPFDCPEEFRIYSFTGNGYTSLSILYAVFAIVSWFAPSVVAIFHAKWSMVISAAIYVIFIASFLFPTTWLLYTLSALLGFGAAVIWTAQGHFLSLVSNANTITRDSGIFWAINQCSFFFGNLLVFYQFQGKTTIDKSTRDLIFIPLTVVGIVGVICFSLLRNIIAERKSEPGRKSNDNDIEVADDSDKPSNKNSQMSSEGEGQAETNFSKASGALVESLKLFITPSMLLLSLSSIYTGLEFSFLSGVYSTSVGNTKMFGQDAKTYVGLIGILLGIGEVVGGALFGLLGTRTTKKGRTPIVFLGALVHVTSFILIYLNLPNDASVKETSEVSHFTNPLPSIAFLCAFFLGFGDACLQTQLISTFASVYKESSAPAFAIFKFTQSAASAAAFYSSSYLGIVIQVVILLVTCFISLISFGIVEWKSYQLQQQQQQSCDTVDTIMTMNNNNKKNVMTEQGKINNLAQGNSMATTTAASATDANETEMQEQKL